jgi:hypothetical protein
MAYMHVDLPKHPNMLVKRECPRQDSNLRPTA